MCYARVKPVSQPGKIPNSWKLELLIPQSISLVPWTSRHKTIIFYKEIESIGKSLKNSPNLQNLITGLTQQKTLQVWIKNGTMSKVCCTINSKSSQHILFLILTILLIKLKNPYNIQWTYLVWFVKLFLSFMKSSSLSCKI